jgi:hypothetical protein
MAKNIWVQRNCGMCGEQFEAYGKQRYCSGACRSAAFRDRDSEHDGPLAKDPTPEEIRHVAQMIRSGQLVIRSKQCITPSWSARK